jgi:tripartite-type tricarboxylate transporter receptor subunit TctC
MKNREKAMSGTKVTRRVLLGGLVSAPLVRMAGAQAAWPNRPVRVIVPYPPAGGADTTARIVFGKLGEMFGQQFVIENRGGAGGTIAEAVAAKADPDGYTVLHDATAFSVNSSLYSNLPFDYKKDFDPVALVSLVPNILVVTPSVPVKTVADIIALAKAAADGIDMASSGNGTLQHLSLEMFRHQTNSLPDIPPVSDTLPGFEAYEWNGVFVPHGTPAPIVQKLNSGINAALRDPNVIARFEQLNIETRPTTPQEFGSFVDEQMARWSKVVKDANIRLG